MKFEEIVFLGGNEILNAINEDVKIVVHKPKNDSIDVYLYFDKGYIYFSDLGMSTYGNSKLDKISSIVDGLRNKFLSDLKDSEDYKEVASYPEDYKIEYDGHGNFDVIKSVNKFDHYMKIFYPESSR